MKRGFHLNVCTDMKFQAKGTILTQRQKTLDIHFNQELPLRGCYNNICTPIVYVLPQLCRDSF